MSIQDILNLLDKAKDNSQLRKTVIGFLAACEQDCEQLQEAAENLKQQLENIEGELAAEKENSKAKDERIAALEEENIAMREELRFYKGISPPPQRPALNAKNESPPEPPPDIDICFFTNTTGYLADICAELLRKILKRCSSKAQVCAELYEEEGKHFILAGFSNGQKAKLINQFLSYPNKLKRFTASDFKMYWKPKPQPGKN